MRPETKEAPLSAFENPMQLQILGEYYFRKGNLTAALDMFLTLHREIPDQYIFCYYLGKIYYRLGNVPQAMDFLCKSKDINPLHRQTLLLLHHCYSRSKDYQRAFECILDLYIMAKEVKDQHIYYYEKRIKSTSRKIENFSAEKKSAILKGRVEALQNFFLTLERNRQNIPITPTQQRNHHAHTEELSPEIGKMQDFDKVEAAPQEEDTFPPAPKPEIIENAAPDDDALIDIENDPLEEDEIQFDVFPANIESGPTLVQTFEDEKTYVDDHNLPSPAPHQAPAVSNFDDLMPAEETKISELPAPTSTHLRDALLQVAFLRQLNEPKLNKIQHFTSILEFKENDLVFQENDPVFGFHILLKGDVQILKGKQPLHQYGQPKIIDEDDFFRVNYRSFSAQAKGPVEMVFFNKAGYQNLFQRDPRVAIAFLWHFSQSLSQKIDGCIEEILLQTPSESFMEELDQKHEVSILRKLGDQELKALTSLFDPIYLKKNDKLYSRQENRKYFFVLLDGQVQCTNPKRHSIQIQKNEYFGEMVFCGPGYPHLYEATVTSPEAKILQISQRQLSSLSQFEENEQKFLADMLVRILANKNKELRELLYQTRYLANKG